MSLDSLNLRIEYVDINKLKHAEYNPRKHSPEQDAQVDASLTRFGCVDPIICNRAIGRENIIIGGNLRTLRARALGIKTLPVVYLNIPDLEKEKELNIRLNKNTGEFDLELLKEFDLDLLTDIGFDKNELLDFWNMDLEVKEEDFDEEEELKKIIIPITKLGDIILLGSSKLICGDSTSPAVLQKLFGDEKASMIFSDPIYNIGVNYDRGLGGQRHYGGDVVDNRTDQEYTSFIKKSLTSALSVCNKDLHIFYWCDESYIWLIQTLYRELEIRNRRVCIWVKNGTGLTPQIAFGKCFEPCVYGTLGKPFLNDSIQNLNEIMNKDLSTGNNLIDEIYDHMNIWLEKRLSSKDYFHATSKPPKLYEKAIRRCSRPGDIILDSFSGSGSTIIAGEQLKRRVFAVELEPVYCDLTIRRFEKLTGIKAKII